LHEKSTSIVLGLEEVENYKYAKVTFLDHKYRYYDTDYSVDEEPNDMYSEDNYPRRLGQKESQTI
jgi:hypothetical protein